MVKKGFKMNNLKNYLKSFVIFETWCGVFCFLLWFLISFIPTGVNEFNEPVFKQIDYNSMDLVIIGSIYTLVSLFFCIMYIEESLGKEKITLKDFLINLGWCVVIVGSFLFLIDFLPSSYGNIDLSLIQIILIMVFVTPVLALVSSLSFGE